MKTNSAESNRPNQPIGLNSGFSCAMARVDELLSSNPHLKSDPNAVIVSVESTLVPGWDNGTCEPGDFMVKDVPCVAIHAPRYHLWFKGKGDGMEFPLKYWELLRAEVSMGDELEDSPGVAVTGGSIIAKCHPTIPHNDWQSHFGRHSRQTQIYSGITDAMDELFLFQHKITMLRQSVRYFDDFPKPGVRFQDINSLLETETHRAMLCDAMHIVAQSLDQTAKITHIAGLDARGFILGGFLAERMKLPFIPLRKKGKLPGPVWSRDYGKEYGKDVLELQKGAFAPAATEPNVLIVDDILATGGTLNAALSLVKQAAVNVAGMLVISEVAELHDQVSLPDDVPLVVLL